MQKPCNKPNLIYSRLWPLPCVLFILIAFLNNKCYSQSVDSTEYKPLLDSVKVFYGDTCCIGVNSRIIERLYQYKQYTPVSDYLKSYEEIKAKIDSFRAAYRKSIYDDNAILLDLSRIFKVYKQCNIVNLCGIYLGPDSVTSLSLSYIILRTTPSKFYSNIYQVANFDSAFKNEIREYGNDWYYSIKLRELTTFPIK